MNNVVTYLKVGVAAIVSGLGYFLGGFDTMLRILIFLMIADYLTGVIDAIQKKELNSSAGFNGIWKKITMLVLVGSTNLLGVAMEIEGLRYMAISFYIANETLSILENASSIGVPVPKKIKEILEQIKDESDSMDELSNGKGEEINE